MTATTQFLVVSTGRCGSTLISDCMNRHPDVLSLSEVFTSIGPDILGYLAMDGPAMWQVMSTMALWTKEMLRLAPVPEVLADISGGEPYPEPLGLITIPHLARRVDHRTQIYGGIRHAFCEAVEAQPRAPVQKHFPAIFDALRERFERKCWVERSGATLDYLEHLLPCFPEAKLIHIYRDGREAALSMHQHPYFQIRAAYKLLAKPHPPTERMLEIGRKLTPGDYGNYWSDMVVKGMKTLTTESHRTLHVCFERLLKNPRPELNRIFDFMEQPVNEQYLEAACAMFRPVQLRGPELDPYDYRALSNACDPGMQILHDLNIAQEAP